MLHRWHLGVAFAVAVLVGTAFGLGAFTFVYARGASYLGNDPATCANCHVMQEHYDAWKNSSHHHVATCNDCHAPPGGLAKYWVKARNGYNHSVAFTSGDFHEPIQITPANRAVTQAQCRRCHADILSAIEPPGATARDRLDCIDCHDSVGHRVRE